MADISPDTQAILLLVAPLQTGGQTEPKLLLTPTEYTRLADALHHQLKQRPRDLLDEGRSQLLRCLESDFDFDHKRLATLLDRGMQLVLALEHWHRCSIRVISRADAAYPRRLKKSLGHRSPSLLYFCGNEDLLHGGGLAVVGSRKVDDQLLDYTRNVGALAAAAGYTIVSGGPKAWIRPACKGPLPMGDRSLVYWRTILSEP